MTVNTLMELDKLVQLIESPIFMILRLHLLEPKKYPHLFKTLFGILMVRLAHTHDHFSLIHQLLPQSSAFTTLRTRLDAVSSSSILQTMPIRYVSIHWPCMPYLKELKSTLRLCGRSATPPLTYPVPPNPSLPSTMSRCFKSFALCKLGIQPV